MCDLGSPSKKHTKTHFKLQSEFVEWWWLPMKTIIKEDIHCWWRQPWSGGQGNEDWLRVCANVWVSFETDASQQWHTAYVWQSIHASTSEFTTNDDIWQNKSGWNLVCAGCEHHQFQYFHASSQEIRYVQCSDTHTQMLQLVTVATLIIPDVNTSSEQYSFCLWYIGFIMMVIWRI